MTARRPFLLALTASLLLHLLVMSSPGWRLPGPEREPIGLPIEAILLAPPREPAPMSAPAALPVPRNVARRPATTPSPASPAVVPKETSPQLPISPRELAPEPPPAPSPVAAESAMPVPAFAAAWPRAGRIRYSVTQGENGFVVGQAEHEWRHDNVTYRLRGVTETAGLAALFKATRVVQESQGIFSPEGLQPLEFRNEREGKLKLSLRFDSSQKRVFSSSGASFEMREPTQDLLSLFFQIGALPLERTEFSVAVATGRKLERYTVTILEMLPLETPFGERDTIHLKLPGARGGDNDEATEVWLDRPTRLPLKIRHRDRKGEVFDLVATTIELDVQP